MLRPAREQAAQPSSARPGSARLRIAAFALAAALTTTACLRLDTPPPEHPELTAAESARQGAAIDAAVIAEAAARIGPGQEEHVAAALAAIAADAHAQVEALGGIWIAWPEGAPEGVATPAPSPTADPAITDPAGVLALLDASWGAARAAATSADATEAESLTLAAVTVSRAAQATRLADAIGVPAPNHTDPANPLVPDALPGVEDSDLVIAYDSARYGLETAAARLPEPYAGWAAARAGQVRAALEAALARGAEDRRQPAYPSGSATTHPDALEMARAAEESLLGLVQSSLESAEPDQRAALIDAATTSATLLARLGGTLPALPGIVEPPEPSKNPSSSNSPNSPTATPTRSPTG